MDLVVAGPAKNALSIDILTALRDHLAEAGDAPILLRGEGDAFSAGLNLKEVLAADEARLKHFLELLNDVTIGLFRHPAPTVACVAGHAIAGGAVLARACDHVVGTSVPGTKIGLNETAIGLVFPPRVLAMLRARLPRRHHTDLLLGAALYDPVEALRRGLLDEIADNAEAVARERFDALCAHPRATYAANKAQILGDVGLPDPEAEARFVRDVLPSWTSPELKQRIERLLGR